MGSQAVAKALAAAKADASSSSTSSKPSGPVNNIFIPQPISTVGGAGLKKKKEKYLPGQQELAGLVSKEKEK
jgi:hypothetical protein